MNKTTRRLLGGALTNAWKRWRWSHDSLLYEVTPRCNLRCAHCYNVWKNGIGYDDSGESPTGRAVALIGKAVRESRCRQLTFTGGEPCLRDDLEELVSAAHRAGRLRGGRLRHVALISNGTLLTTARVRQLKDAGVALFELPLNSADRHRHDSMAGADDCFDSVVQAAAEIGAVGAHLAFVFVGTRANMADWPEVLRLGTALGGQSFLFNRYNAGGAAHAHPEKLLPTIEQLRDALAEANRFAERYGVDISASTTIPPCLIDHAAYPKVGFGFCAAGTPRAYYTIDPLGNIRPCNHTSTTLGNLFDAHLAQIVLGMLGNPKLTEFRAARPEFCSGCRLERECQGGCKAAAEACFGDLCSCEPLLAANIEQAKPLSEG